ncbi:MAG: hypothetical protein HOC74_19060 [Gemmatimonadetes bacterium]|jgi:hypothetical protein|nr:hypothetical protein [Gemmatimonadota bacterium]
MIDLHAIHQDLHAGLLKLRDLDDYTRRQYVNWRFSCRRRRRRAARREERNDGSDS